MDYENKIDIPFGAKDSELKGWEYTIPEGMEAEIKDGKVIVREKESENEKMVKAIEHILYENYSDAAIIEGVEIAEIVTWLEKQKINAEGDFGRGYNCGYEACLHSHGAEWFEKQKEQKSTDKSNINWSYLEEYPCSKEDAYESIEKGDATEWRRKEQRSDGKAMLHVADKAYQIGLRDGRMEQKPAECELEDAFKYYTDAGITVSCGDIVAKPNNRKPAEWNFPYGVNETADKLIAIAECLEMDGNCLFNGHTGTECGKFLRELARKQTECKSEGWSEKDEECRKELIQYIEQRIGDGTTGQSLWKKWHSWLCFLPLNLKKKNEDVEKLCSNEWSEEDDMLMDELESYILYDKEFNDEQKSWRIKRLKSFRSRLHWKPSKVQMAVLKNAIHFYGKTVGKEVLESLYNDLNKNYKS